MNIPHPRYPLQSEQREAIREHGHTVADIDRINAEFAQRRDAEFHGWRATYDAEIAAWALANGASPP